MGNIAKQCRLGLFQDLDFATVLEDSKSTSGGTLCVFGSHTFVPVSWMWKKQTSVSHSSTESEIISLDAGLRLDGSPALELWDLIVSVLGNIIQNHDRTGRPVVCSHRARRSSNQEIETRSSRDCKNSNLDVHLRASLERKCSQPRRQPRCYSMYIGPSLNSKLCHWEGTTSWPTTWEG